MIQRTINEAGNAELARRDPAYVRVPSGEVPGEAVIFEHSISHAQWRWPEGIPDPLPQGWPRPWQGEVPDYYEVGT